VRITSIPSRADEIAVTIWTVLDGIEQAYQFSTTPFRGKSDTLRLFDSCVTALRDQLVKDFAQDAEESPLATHTT
jgi:hypothetical protein